VLAEGGAAKCTECADAKRPPPIPAMSGGMP
jgi:hypothetical protein